MKKKSFLGINKKNNIRIGHVFPFLVLLVFFLCASPSVAEIITDHTGRSFQRPRKVNRVVSLAPSITEIVFSIGCQDRLVGVTQYSDYPREAENLPSVGSYVYLDPEKIVSLRPDICLAVKDGNPISVIRRLEEMGIAVYAVNPRDIDSVMDAIKGIGSVLGAENQAGDVVDDMQRRMDKVRKKVKGIDKRPGVFFQIGVDPIVSAGSDTFIHELISLAGGRNLAGGQIGYPRYSVEDVLAMAPDVIIVTSMARQQVFDRVVKQWRQWKDLPAVINDRIHLVDSNLYDRPSPRLIQGLEELLKLIHPDASAHSGEN
jgi:iron complex transport system substrate-binding protein